MWKTKTVQREKQEFKRTEEFKRRERTEQVKGERRDVRSQGETVLASSKPQLKL